MSWLVKENFELNGAEFVVDGCMFGAWDFGVQAFWDENILGGGLGIMLSFSPYT